MEIKLSKSIWLIVVANVLIVLGISAFSAKHMVENSESVKRPYEEMLEKFDLNSKMSHYGVPGISFAVLENGKLSWAKGYGVLQKGSNEQVNTETVFSVGSVSKVGAAVVTLKLQESGILSIDSSVNNYLKSWKIPENQYTKNQSVTLRHIMSHTGGLTVHGFADFNPHETLPTTVQILKGEWPAKNSPVYVDIPVGSRYRYSGGGTTVEQLVIEESFDLHFHEIVDSLLFKPLKMNRSSYENPLPEIMGNIAKAHNRNGNPVALPIGYQSMPETAASGLWTTPSDFAKLMIMLMNAYNGLPSYLNQYSVKDMMTPVPPSSFGLGPKINITTSEIMFSHGGSNDSYRAHFIGSLNKKNGIIIFTNGTGGSNLINELLPLFERLLF